MGKTKPNKFDSELVKIAVLIDQFVDGEAVDPLNAAYVNGMIVEREHADNGNGSTLHPLTAIHHSTGTDPHFTLQAGWLQTLCLRHLGLIDDSGLQIMACATVKATKKSEVKAAQDQAYGKAVQSIDNIHFYGAKSKVETTQPTLTQAMETVNAALGKLGEIGRNILEKDAAFLEKHADHGGYRLKALEQPAWDRLAPLLKQVAASTAPFVRRSKVERNETAKLLLDVLTRVRAQQPAQ